MLGVGSAIGVLLMDRTTAPQSLGIDPGSLWETYSPLILGVIASILNNGDWPDWVKKIGTKFIEEKGGDIKGGNGVLSLYLELVKVLEGYRKNPVDNAEKIAHLRLMLLDLHEDVVGYSDK
jgi:hypothetical protein